MEFKTLCTVVGVALVGACGVASICLLGWLFNEVKKLQKEVKRLRKLFTQVCKNWSVDAEDVAAEILEMVADHETEKAELEAKIKNLKHANKQLAKGERSND